ncbi:MAG: hypothetical protein KDB53_14130, partial [Planctomycetes bacterium]|nr:hypothetical protein [Planctomycetota bacterium]
DPGAALFIRDGLGLRGPPDPTMIAGTTLSQGLIVPPAILPGTVVVTQLITFDPALPFDVAIGISPPITLIL